MTPPDIEQPFIAVPAAIDNIIVAYLTKPQVAAVLQTTTRSIDRWILEGRFPAGRKFGKLTRWPKDQIEHIALKGVARAGDEHEQARAGALAHFAAQGVEIECPHCTATVLVTKGGAPVLVKPPKRNRQPASEKAKPTSKKPAK